jgi:methionyl aminopeptidase
MHEDPQVPNYVSRSLKYSDFRLEPGLVLAIEPMVNAGSKATEINARDHWTVVTKDRQPSVHFEHTVAITADGPLILTAPITD